jgi:hypothetical protein
MTPDAQQPYFCPHCGVRSDRATIKSELVSIDIPHAWVCYNCGWKWIDVDIMQKNIRARPHTPAPKPKCDDCRFRKDCSLLYFPPCEQMARQDENHYREASRTATLATLDELMTTVSDCDVGGNCAILKKIGSLRASGEQDHG